MRNHSYENDFDLHENETACRTHFHMKGFALLRLALIQRQRTTQKMAYYGFTALEILEILSKYTRLGAGAILRELSNIVSCINRSCIHIITHTNSYCTILSNFKLTF